ncbi:Crp/Fnr family transcriptional regulator [Pseudoroseomonas globiformis]|uniref:Crp/Fnr family transcriptional regulator n=1 Tax=Teichococcus globiformis TaxID=2307229 RepID=A0ABV7G7U4_9PROT
MPPKPSLTPLPGSCATCGVRPHDLFRAVPAEQIDKVAATRAAVRLARAGQPIHDTVFSLFAGWAFTWRATPEGRRQILDFHLPGDLVEHDEAGEETVTALTDASFCVLSRERLCAFMGRDACLAMSYAEGLSEDRARLRERLTSLGRRDALGRLAHLLLELQGRLAKRGTASGDGGPLPLRQAHLADALGLSVEHVNRALAQLRRNRVALLRKGRLEILDRAALGALADWPDAPAPALLATRGRARPG